MAFFIPALIGLGAIAGGIGLGSAAQRTIVRPRDERYSQNYNGKMRDVLGLFEQHERASDLNGLDQIAYSREIQSISFEERVDMTNSARDLDTVNSYLQFRGLSAVQRAHENPDELSMADPWLTAGTQLQRGVFHEGFGLLMDAPKRMLDLSISQERGYSASTGQHTADALGIDPEEDPLGYNFVSGTLDAGAIFLGDPAIVGGKAYKALRAARYAPKAMHELPGVQNWAQKLTSENMTDGGKIWQFARQGGGAIDRGLANDLAGMVARGTPAEDLAFQLQVGMQKAQVYQFPQWTTRRAMHGSSIAKRLPGTRFFRRVHANQIDFHSPQFEDEMHRAFRQFTDSDELAAQYVTQIPRHGDPQRAIPEFNRLYQSLFREKVDRAYMEPHRFKMTADLGLNDAPTFSGLADQIDNIPASRLDDVADKLGLSFRSGTLTDQKRRTIAKHISDQPSKFIDENWSRLNRRGINQFFGQNEQAYANALIHESRRPPGDMPILPSQLQNQMPIPDAMAMRSFWKEADRLADGKGIGHHPGETIARQFENVMGHIRSLWLFRVGWFMKAMTEETMVGMMHPVYGRQYRNHLADSIIDYGQEQITAGSRFMRLTAKKAENKLTLKEARQLSKQEARSNTPRQLRDLMDEGERVLDAATINDQLRSYAMNQTYWSQRGGVSASMVNRARNQRGMTHGDGAVWTNLGPKDNGFTSAWAHMVNRQLLESPVTKLMLKNWENPRQARRAAIDWLESGEGQIFRRNFASEVGGDSAKYADMNMDFINALLPDERMVEEALRGGVSFRTLEKISKANPEIAPKLVSGPVSVSELGGRHAMQAQGQMWDQARQRFFGWAGYQIDRFGRSPFYTAAYRTERRRLEEAARHHGTLGNQVSPEDLDRAASTLAGRAVIRYMDTPLDRRYYEMMFRGLLPFADAHRRFYARWGRTLRENPAAVEKTRLLMTAGESLGWVEPDDFGNLVFTMPIVPEVAAAILPGDEEVWKKRFSTIVGRGIAPHQMGEIRAEVEETVKPFIPELVPYSTDILPGFSPILSLPLSALTQKFPNMRELTDQILGPYPGWQPDKGFTNAVLSGVWGGWIDRLLSSVENADTNRMKAGAYKDALEYKYKKFHDEHGRFPQSNEEIERLRREVDDMASSTLRYQALIQFHSPYRPANIPYGKEISDDWHEMRKTHGPEIGFERFMEKYGEGAVFYTQRQSKWTEGAPIALSDEAETFFSNNPAFFRDHPEVAGYFTRDMAEEFDPRVLGRLRAQGQRENLPPADLVAEAMIRLGNREYYDEVRPQYEILKRQASGRQEKEQVQRWVEAQREDINARYPGWIESWADFDIKGWERTVDELRAAVHHPAVRDMEGARVVRQFLAEFDAADKRARELYMAGEVEAKDITSARRYRPVRDHFEERAKELMAQSNSRIFSDIYDSLFRRKLERFEDDLDMLEIGQENQQEQQPEWMF